MAGNTNAPQSRRFNLLSVILDGRVLGVIGQIAFVIGFILAVQWFTNNIINNLDTLGESQFICVDGTSKPRCAFDFLSSDSQFDIAESPVDYDPADSYWRALWVGTLNTLKVISLGVVLTTIVGTLIGIARLSQNWLVANIAKWYVDILRNTPLVLQLIFLYFSVLLALPPIEEAFRIPGVPLFISQRGVNFANLDFMPSSAVWLAFLVLAAIQAQIIWMVLGRREQESGNPTNRMTWVLIAFFSVATAGWMISSNEDNQSVLVPRSLQVGEIDEFEQLILRRFDVNNVSEIATGLEDGTITEDFYEENALSLCVLRDAVSETNFTSQLRRAGIPFEVDRSSTQARATSSYIDGDCDVYVAPTSILSGERELLETPSTHLMLPVFERPVRWSIPRIEGFNFVGGGKMTAEFTALFIGLVLNTAAYIAEITRAGIQSVSKGQTEAARALGLSEGQRLRLVVLPQALRVIIPPQTSQYLNLAKNSTLALAIAYPDFWNVATTTINQSGRSIQIIVITMVLYLTISLTVSGVLNWYNQRISLVER